MVHSILPRAHFFSHTSGFLLEMYWLWIGLFALVSIILIIDLGVIHRRGRELSLAESIGWTLVWLAVGGGFSGAVYLLWDLGHIQDTTLTPPEAVIDYITCWVLELSLSLDNIFVMALIFKRWRIPEHHQHSVLFYGIIGAVIFRTLMIFVGVSVIDRFEWLLPVFGLYLLYQGAKALWEHYRSDEASEKTRPLPGSFIGIPILQPDHDGHFLTRTSAGKFAVTTLVMALLWIEAADLLFALDSVPAALAVTRESWIIVSANVLAIIGLRSMYSVLAGVLNRYKELHVALALLLLFIGTKMVLLPWHHIPNVISLSILLTLLVGGMLVSVYLDRRRRGKKLGEL